MHGLLLPEGPAEQQLTCLGSVRSPVSAQHTPHAVRAPSPRSVTTSWAVVKCQFARQRGTPSGACPILMHPASDIAHRPSSCGWLQRRLLYATTMRNPPCTSPLECGGSHWLVRDIPGTSWFR